MSYWQSVLTQMGWPSRNEEKPIGSIGLSSCAHGHGVSTVAKNVAVTAALAAEVLLIDANTRRPTLAKELGVKEGSGLIDALAERMPPQSGVQQSSYPGLSVLPFGDPSNVEGGNFDRFSPVFRTLAADYELVICDFAPITADAEFLSWFLPLDRVFLILGHGKTDAALARASATMLRRTGADVSGVIINQSNEKTLEF